MKVTFVVLLVVALVASAYGSTSVSGADVSVTTTITNGNGETTTTGSSAALNHTYFTLTSALLLATAVMSSYLSN